jgi:hypothetical protein
MISFQMCPTKLSTRPLSEKEMENLLNECLISVRSISKQKEETFKVSRSCEGCTNGLFFP